MKRFFSLLFCGSFGFTSLSQSSHFQISKDSIRVQIQNAKEDTTRVNLLIELGGRYPWTYPDSALQFSNQALALALKLEYKKGIYNAQNLIISALTTMGNYPLALEYSLKNEELSKTFTVPKPDPQFVQGLKFINISKDFLDRNQPDSALFYGKRSYLLINTWPTQPVTIGHAYIQKNMFDSAMYWFHIGLKLADLNQTGQDFVDVDNLMSILHKKKNNIDSAIWYAKKALSEIISKYYPLGTLKASDLLVSLYEAKKEPDSVLRYLRMSIILKDSLFSREKVIAEQNLIFNKQQKEKELEASRLRYRNQAKMYLLSGGLLALLIIAFILFRANRQKQRSYIQLQHQKDQIDFHKTMAEKSLIELKATQAQLIQSEKMASLGELTAGIAHEIQNPLNFVNNFSEVNKELVDEMQQELKKGKMDDAIAISNNIKENEEKINQHGKRADAIVKGMLQHSRKSKGEKEPTNINGLANEYLRLAYHGVRTKDNTFLATLKTDFDENIGDINIIPQDIGKVILNLITNAFYAVSEKKSSFAKEDSRYEPTITVSSQKVDDKVELRVKDNGVGIPEKIVDKIFQPFFTTRPTGQGTGLGLSLSYDIVKAHGGELKVETREGEGSEFIIQLPMV